MTYQAYIDNIKAKTGLSPQDFQKLAKGKNFQRIGDAIAWLKADYGLGHGHANTIAHIVLNPEKRDAPSEEKLTKQFSGNKAHWRTAYDKFAVRLQKLGGDVELVPNSTYINVRRGAKRIGIVQISSSERVDIGVKLKGVASTARLEPSGTWNPMVTHRIRVGKASELDSEVLGWFSKAYAAAR